MPRPKGLPKTGGRKKGGVGRATLKRVTDQIEAARVTVERVLAEYAHLGFLDIRQAFDEKGNLKQIHELPDSVARAIAGIEFEEVFEVQGSGADRARVHVGRIHKIKIASKLGALDSMGKHLGMFVEKLRLVDGAGQDSALKVLVEYVDKPSPSADTQA